MGRNAGSSEKCSIEWMNLCHRSVCGRRILILWSSCGTVGNRPHDGLRGWLAGRHGPVRQGWSADYPARMPAPSAGRSQGAENAKSTECRCGRRMSETWRYLGSSVITRVVTHSHTLPECIAHTAGAILRSACGLLWWAACQAPARFLSVNLFILRRLR